MSPLVAGALARAAEPTPNPTEGQLRPGLESWQVSPGLIGFVVTFALALACVLLFLNMSKHLRRAGHNARQQGLPVATQEGIGFRRSEGDTREGDTSAADGAEGTDAADTPDSAGTSDVGSSPSSDSPSGGGSSGGDSGGTGG
ncbi:hypothetical protein ACFT2C_28455 [Promicromonospora sp. NPDC057138]|uniref:hypothetical protein n=1 Tax=Promicromonospora sp. NPDC057138 TaxID=3346031 RepID=UPI0036289F30